MSKTADKVLKSFLPVIAVVVLAYFSSCKSGSTRALHDTRDSGIINVSCDETFKPIIDEMVKVYQSRWPKAQINVIYKTETECLDDIDNDSIRMIIATRRLNSYEENHIVDSFRIDPETRIMALDAIAVIVHPDNPDSLFTMDEIRQILTGKFRKNLIPVFDGVKATSTVRFIVDSVLVKDSLTKNAVAARTSEGVIDYIATKKDAIGFIGVSWIGNRDDSMQLSYLKKVKVAQLESLDSPGKFIIPAQANIYLMRYPMIRDLVYILKEKNKGLGKGFGDFMTGNIGQLIFHRAYLMPAWKDFYIRPAELVEE
jgi:phosphate transport system substrate-binding protein